MRTTKHPSRDPFRLLERGHGLAEMVERRAVVPAARLRVTPPHPERDIVTLSENTACYAHRFAQQCLGFFEALCIDKVPCVIIGFSKGFHILLCALKLWRVAFDNLGRHVKCGGVLFITDLLGDVFTGDGPRCWPEFGRRWMVENNFEHVRRQTGDPCGNHYPFLFLRRKC